jgi:hypothetical protein
MKTMKSLLALSALVAAAGATEAATVATFDYSGTNTIYGYNAKTQQPILTQVIGNGASVGTGVLDDNGTLTVQVSNTYFQDPAHAPVHQYDAVETLTFIGTIDNVAHTFSYTQEGMHVVSCVPTGGYSTGCTNVVDSPLAASTNPWTISIADGITTSRTLGSALPAFGVYTSSTTNFTAHVATPAVPVPAAAWLFGSGLAGLAGTARRRK